ncbi:MAG: hypothetical protein LBG45_10700 [Dysgonamonadaceae bacterium]|jgi:protein-S-isoprenylcysteine O-methyltransferase Ste14|nr:hypothetical protein [Dysgonamonadaceae bacterium]
MDNKVFLQKVVFNNKTSNKVLFYIITVCFLTVAGTFFYLVDPVSPFAPVISQFIIVLLALVGLGGFYTSKKKLLVKNSNTAAYRKAFFRFHVTFIPFVYMGTIHSYFVCQPPLVDNPWFNLRYIFAAYLILTGITLHIRARKIFGTDNLFMYYVYHPDENKMIESIIHGIIRHPVYSAMNRIAWAGAFFSGSWVSFILAFLFTCNQAGWLVFYEEPELVKRFGNSYVDFKKRTPALYPKLSRYADFIKFLSGKVK